MTHERVFRLYPTFENAISFLKDKHIHIPFESLIRNSNQNNESTLSKRPRLNMNGGTNTEQIHNLSRLDFLHDISNTFPVDQSILVKVLENTTLSTSQKTSVQTIIHSNKAITKGLASIIMRKRV